MSFNKTPNSQENSTIHILEKISESSAGKELNRLLTHLFGIPADYLMKIRVARFAHIQDKRAKKAALLGVSEPRMLPEKIAHEVMLGASLEQDEDMQELWANLLANHDAGMSINVVMVNILRNLDGNSAKVLLYFWEKAEKIRSELQKCRTHDQAFDVRQKMYVSDSELQEKLGIWAPTERIRLYTLGLIMFGLTGTQETYFALEEIGYMLCKAVTGPSLSNTPVL